ncbi:MAG: hypothetical protein ABMA15_23185 [Vicinamibacterales bacterium]
MRNAEAVHALDQGLRAIFGRRMQSFMVHGGSERRDTPVATLAVVDTLTAADLRQCASSVARWHEQGLATPLIVGTEEFARSLDAFPFEFGAILADHELVSGSDPFSSLVVDPGDLRRACEVQARSHLLHLREAYIETRGQSDVVAALVARSAPPLAALLTNVALLHQAPTASSVLTRVSELGAAGTISADEADRLFPDYLLAVEQLVLALDRWRAA